MKLVVDMNLSTGWVEALRAEGIDAVHWADIGRPDAPDETIMAWAKSNGAVVLTRDLDFATLLMRQRLAAPSVIQLRADRVRLDRHLISVMRALSLHRIHLENGAVVTLDDERTRVRILDHEAES